MMKAYLAIGAAPSTGGCYATEVMEVLLTKQQESLLDSQEWYNVTTEFPQTKTFFRCQKPLNGWTYDQWELCKTREEAEKAASRWN